jgi:putative ABC transport system permease protein
MNLIVRTTGRPETLIPAIRAIVREIDPAQPAPSFQTVEQLMSDAVAPRRFSFVLLGIFAAVGGLLSAIGLYGVMAYLVTERTSEIGIRTALGADRARVIWLVIREGMTLAMVGLVLGLGGSIAGVRALRSLLYQVDVYDPVVFGVGAMLLAVIAMVACALPAWRAARIDPATALRAN